jgi:CRP-like cAMP-binding protein
MRAHAGAGAPRRTAPDNPILANLPAAVRERLSSRLEAVSLRRGQSLCDAGEPVRHLYFLTSGLVSLLGVTASGGLIELATVTNEGVVGLPIILSHRIAPYRASVQIAGTALRLRADAAAVELAPGTALRDALHAYATELLADIAKTVTCVAFHDVLQRVCRWLLTASDRLGTNTVDVTQETVALSLGVVRQVVSRAMVELQDANAIRSRYGRIVIVNRGLLERSSCECYTRSSVARDNR